MKAEKFEKIRTRGFTRATTLEVQAMTPTQLRQMIVGLLAEFNTTIDMLENEIRVLAGVIVRHEK